MLQLLMILLVVAVLQATHAFQSPTSSFHRHIHQGNGYHNGEKITSTSLFLSSSDIQAKLKAQMAKLQERDRASVALSPDVSFL